MEKAKTTFQGIYGMMWEKPPLMARELNEKKTALVVIDMLNGFVREGAMKNPLAEEIIPPIVALMRYFKERQMPILAFGDCHEEDALEFQSYPVHCRKGTTEAELVQEIQEVGGYEYIPKNSTNGVLEEAFQRWAKEHPEITDWVITGVCTDICVMQFCLTLKAWCNQQGRASRLILPLNTMETFDGGGHQITLTNTMAVYFMEQSGAEICYEINLNNENPIRIYDATEEKDATKS